MTKPVSTSGPVGALKTDTKTVVMPHRIVSLVAFPTGGGRLVMVIVCIERGGIKKHRTSVDGEKGPNGVNLPCFVYVRLVTPSDTVFKRPRVKDIRFTIRVDEWTPPDGWQGPIEHSLCEFVNGTWYYFVWTEW